MKNEKHKYKLGEMIYTSYGRWGIIIKRDWNGAGMLGYEVHHTNGIVGWFLDKGISKRKKNWGSWRSAEAEEINKLA